MNETEAIEALKSFIDDNEDLENLESRLDRFNVFESLGLVRQEIRHSAFLRWLLDPTETHGLGDYWLRRFLRIIIKACEEKPWNTPSLFDLDGWDLGETEVYKEWHNIDLLILDNRNKFVCALENKVDAGEAKGQLQRYRKIVEQEFGGYKRAYVFLTKYGQRPSDEAYVQIGYKDVVAVIENALKRRESQINDDIKLFVGQYLDMVRRHIVKESEIQELCRRIYQKHRRALDQIFEYRPDRAAQVSQTIQDHIKSRPDLISISNSKTYIKFLPECMDIPELHNEGKRILAWLLENKGNKVKFRLELQPGSKDVRERIYERAKSAPRVFGKAKSLSPQYHTFFSESWISQKDYDELDDEGIKQRVDGRITGLLERKGEAMVNALRRITQQ